MTTEQMDDVDPKLKKLDTLWWAVALIMGWCCIRR